MGLSRKKPSPNATPGWTPPSSNPQNTDSLSKECHGNLISIAEAIHTANGEYLTIVGDYLRWFARFNKRSQKPGRFTAADRDVLKHTIEDETPIEKSAILQLLSVLSDTSYTGIWKRAADNMAFLKTLPTHQTQKHQDKGRKRAELLKNCRITVLNGFNSAEKELRALGHDDVCEGIETKIDMLRKFEDVYPISSNSVPSSQFNIDASTLISIAFVWIILSSIFTFIAWSKSTNAPGSIEDPDFYLQIQNALVQFLGFVTSVFTVHHVSRDNILAWRWALCLAIGGIVCGFMAIPMYLYISPMWSSTVASFSSIAQIAVIAVLAMVTNHPKVKQA
ncbi:hypothetical protein M426DRAFT_135473 [Hypoxylon sp. CI-4A]|nr:hypothetical protein M426DRAFT_135473 [Hypoxylon sp. CI-4A]